MLCEELRSVQIEDDEMEMSDDDRDSRCCSTKKARFDSESLKEENDSLRCQIDAMRNEMFMNRTELRHDSDFREKQIKVLQETIRNMQTQLLQTKMREQKDAKSIEMLEHELKEARVRMLLLQTKVKETIEKYRISKTNTLNPLSAGKRYEKSDVNITSNNDVEAEYVQHNKKNFGEIDDKEDTQEAKNFEKSIKTGENYGTAVDEHYETDLNGVNKSKGYVKVDKGIDLSLDVKVNRENFVPENSIKLDQLEKASVPEEHTNKAIKESMQCTDDAKTEFKSLELCEARIIALAAAFLVIQPQGASSESICCYLKNFMTPAELKTSSLDVVLSKYENLFKSIDLASSCNGRVETKWIFCGFL